MPEVPRPLTFFEIELARRETGNVIYANRHDRMQLKRDANIELCN